MKKQTPFTLPPSMVQGTAVITGASAGIGAEYARQLAAQKLNLLLVARRTERLAVLAQTLQDQYGVVVESYSADLSDLDQLHRLAEFIRQRDDLALLINNAGFGTVGHLDTTSVPRQLEMLNLHVTATYLLAQAALTPLLKRQGGGIINVSSIAGFFFTPENVNYCATKAYITNFSQGLQLEVENAHIRVQALCPGYTITEFHSTEELRHIDRTRVPSAMWMSAEEVVRISLQALWQDQVVVVPGRRNQFLLGMGRFLPMKAIRPILRRIRSSVSR